MNIKRSAALIMIAVLLLCGLSGCKDGQGFDSDTPSVAIIIKGSESDFWNDVKKGALSAATMFNPFADFPFTSPHFSNLKILRILRTLSFLSISVST